MQKSFFKEVILVKNDLNGYTLILPCAFKIEAEHIPLISDPINQEAFESSLAYCGMWWIGRSQGHSLVLNKIEVILPPFMEYLPVSQLIYESFKKDGVLLEIKSGIRLEVVEEEMNESKEYINEKLSQLAKRSFNNN